MPNILPLHPDHADASTQQTFKSIASKLGRVPNMFLTLAHSPVALNAYTRLAETSTTGKLTARLREQIALVVGQDNGCDYCLAAHAAIGGMLGLTPAQIEAARRAQASTQFDQAVLELAAQITRERGLLSPQALATYRARGLSDSDVLEVLVNVVLNILTNYTNHLAATEIDFPLPQALAA